MKKITFDEAVTFKNRERYVYFQTYFDGLYFRSKGQNDTKRLNHSDGGRLMDKIRKKHKIEYFQCNIVGKIKKYGFLHISIYDIYRIEILDDKGNIIDAINTHKEGVPKEIREEFDKQFRNDDGTDRIYPLDIG